MKPDTAFMDDRERDVRKYLKKRLKEVGGELRKVRWTGRSGAPDELVMLPARCIWVELKRPGKEPTSQQAREHERLRFCGALVTVLHSREDVDSFFTWA
jgi:hypothetical protein